MAAFSGAFVVATSSLSAAEPAPTDILKDMRRVADWQLANPSEHDLDDWTQAPFFLGLSELSQVSGETSYLEALDAFGKELSYGPGRRTTHADDHAVLQAWLELYKTDKDQTKLAPSIAHFDNITEKLSSETAKSISGGTFTWCWCDALFMSPPVWAHLSKLTGDPKFLEWADKEWWTTTDVLYDPAYHLFYRDNNFFKKQTASGKKVFWSRGNGWVVGGLVHMLDQLPEDHPSREKYLGLYHDMIYQLLTHQNPDGLWRPSLLDSGDALGESSGSAFFVYAMAWGVNRGLLPAETFRPALMKGYVALTKNIQPSGMLGFVQQIGSAPDKREITAESTEVYGSGAFLLAGAEVIRLLDPSKKKSDVASFEGVTLPKSYLPAEPRTYARFVPERADDFTWENDLIAFRTYGPALRDSTEDSGFDCWFKRVPYPVIDKWYMEELNKLRYGKVNKSYHEDQGEGLDAYKVGNTRGCGGISAWSNGEIFNSNTYIAHRIIENSPEKSVFELDFASDYKGQTLRETKRITLIMGERMFQCDSRFTLDGKPAANLEVAIGLTFQAGIDSATFSAKPNSMMLWDTLKGLGIGTGIVIDPSYVVEMKSKIADQTQALCLARTDDQGSIRWFTGFGWEGQREITSPEEWVTYLEKFSAKYLESPFADYSEDSTFKVHTLKVPSTE
ncbi:MAG: glycoside hydrolase family 88 protein [Luteolibacter sp.]